MNYVYQYTKAVDDRKLEKMLGVFVIEQRKPITIATTSIFQVNGVYRR